MVSMKSPEELIKEVNDLAGDVTQSDFCLKLSGICIEFNEVVNSQDERGPRNVPLRCDLFDLRVKFSIALMGKGVSCFADLAGHDELQQAREQTHYPMRQAADAFSHGDPLTEKTTQELQQLCDKLAI